jgi:Uma2 family endonuclease
MPDTIRRWTREDLLDLPDDGNRYELLDGELLVTPSPNVTHQRAVLALFLRIHPFVARHALGEVLLAPADLDFRSGQSLQPDLFVVATPVVSRGKVPDWSDFGIPTLIVEVLSPSTAVTDRNRKRLRYQRSGVGEYWIVDTDGRLIERWQPEDERPEVLLDRIEWRPVEGMPPLVLDLGEYFREVWREPEGAAGSS